MCIDFHIDVASEGLMWTFQKAVVVHVHFVAVFDSCGALSTCSLFALFHNV